MLRDDLFYLFGKACPCYSAAMDSGLHCMTCAMCSPIEKTHSNLCSCDAGRNKLSAYLDYLDSRDMSEREPSEYSDESPRSGLTDLTELLEECHGLCPNFDLSMSKQYHCETCFECEDATSNHFRCDCDSGETMNMNRNGLILGQLHH